MRQKLGCAVFFVLGLAWIAFTAFAEMTTSLGACGPDAMCLALAQSEQARIIWRGIAVGLLLIIAYAMYRRFFEDGDVQ